LQALLAIADLEPLAGVEERLEDLVARPLEAQLVRERDLPLPDASLLLAVGCLVEVPLEGEQL